MKILARTVEHLKITEVEGLDPIDVCLEDLGPNQGKIAITCYGKSWTSYWGAMSDRTIAEFFKQAGNDYLVSNLSQGISSTMTDPDTSGFIEQTKQKIIQRRKEYDLESDVAREYYDEAKDDFRGMSYDEIFQEYGELLESVWGDDAWINIPQVSNPQYEYLCRIVDAVKEAIVKHGAHAIKQLNA